MALSLAAPPDDRRCADGGGDAVGGSTHPRTRNNLATTLSLPGRSRIPRQFFQQVLPILIFQQEIHGLTSAGC